MLVPGTPGDAGQFAALAAALRDRYTVITYDRRGAAFAVEHPVDEALDPAAHGAKAAATPMAATKAPTRSEAILEPATVTATYPAAETTVTRATAMEASRDRTTTASPNRPGWPRPGARRPGKPTRGASEDACQRIEGRSKGRRCTVLESTRTRTRRRQRWAYSRIREPA